MLLGYCNNFIGACFLHFTCKELIFVTYWIPNIYFYICPDS